MTLLSSLQSTIAKLDANNAAFQTGSIKPVQHGEKRINILMQGLVQFSDIFGFPANVRYESTGEFTFNGNRGRHCEDPCEPFGEPLTQWLNTIHTRTGISPSKGYVIPQNGWTRIDHFAAEDLLRRAANSQSDTPD